MVVVEVVRVQSRELQNGWLTSADLAAAAAAAAHESQQQNDCNFCVDKILYLFSNGNSNMSNLRSWYTLSTNQNILCKTNQAAAAAVKMLPKCLSYV